MRENFFLRAVPALVAMLFLVNDVFAQSKDKVNTDLKIKLENLFDRDQAIRNTIDSLINIYGWDSKEVNAQFPVVARVDSINLSEGLTILNKSGWLGIDKVGAKANQALFLLVQHGNLKIQKKYLNSLRQSVRKKQSHGIHLAMLEDRIAIGENRDQTYGTQVRIDNEGKYFVYPVSNPDQLDKRRKSIGLNAMAEYVKNYNILWDVETYKKELHKYIKML